MTDQYVYKLYAFIEKNRDPEEVFEVELKDIVVHDVKHKAIKLNMGDYNALIYYDKFEDDFIITVYNAQGEIKLRVESLEFSHLLGYLQVLSELISKFYSEND